MSKFVPMSRKQFADRLEKITLNREIDKIILHMLWLREGNEFWGEKTMQGLEKFYSNQRRKRAFHYAIEGEDIWPFAPLEQRPHQGGPNKINDKSIAIEMDGVIYKRAPKRESWDTYMFVIRALMKKFDIPKSQIFLHREFHKGTPCPGFNKRTVLENL